MVARIATVVTDGISINGLVTPEYAEILTPEALAFIATLHRSHNATRIDLLNKRIDRQCDIDAGHMPGFLEMTEGIRESKWKIAPIPNDLRDRRVEITGPTDRKMVINALNSGVQCFMADFEDSNSPTWDNMVQGQINMRDAVNRTIAFTNSEGKQYKLFDHPATLMIRPRGWHLVEEHLRVDNQPVSGSIFDFALYFFHNARTLLNNGSGPYYYLPKLQNHLEARLWNDLFKTAQDELGIPRGSIKATVLIEHVLASFEADEILYELRDHSAGLNCGRWDYIFSFVKTFRNNSRFVLPDRDQISMSVPLMRNYVRYVIQTCHRRGAHAMGGMAAQIPIKSDPKANEAAIAKVRADKLREVEEGHDGTWVAHPGLVSTAMDIFNEKMPGPNQIDRPRGDVMVTANDLLEVPRGNITEKGLRHNISVGVQYLESWLRGNGCVPLYHLMEDAATAEISRTQIWQWIRHRAKLSDGYVKRADGTVAQTDGVVITKELFKSMLRDELKHIREGVGEERFAAGAFVEAADIFDRISTDETLVDFLTLPAYELLGKLQNK